MGLALDDEHTPNKLQRARCFRGSMQFKELFNYLLIIYPHNIS